MIINNISYITLYVVINYDAMLNVIVNYSYIKGGVREKRHGFGTFEKFLRSGRNF